MVRLSKTVSSDLVRSHKWIPVTYNLIIFFVHKMLKITWDQLIYWWELKFFNEELDCMDDLIDGFSVKISEDQVNLFWRNRIRIRSLVRRGIPYFVTWKNLWSFLAAFLSRIRIFSPKTVSTLSEKWSGMFIPAGVKKHRIPYSDPQHCFAVRYSDPDVSLCT